MEEEFELGSDTVTIDVVASPEFKEAQIKQFQDTVYRYQAQGLTLLESILEYCTERDMEMDDIKPYITSRLMADLNSEALTMNRLKKAARFVELDFG